MRLDITEHAAGEQVGINAWQQFDDADAARDAVLVGERQESLGLAHDRNSARPADRPLPSSVAPAAPGKSGCLSHSSLRGISGRPEAERFLGVGDSCAGISTPPA
jgi:hypothetical protein